VDCWLLLQNPSSSPVIAAITLFGTDGQATTLQRFLPPTSRQSVFVSQLFPAPSFGMLVEASGEIVAEKSVFMGASAFSGNQPQGACCYPDGSCAITFESGCATGHWTLGALCLPNPCPQPTGACCATDGTCTETLQADCQGQWTMFGSHSQDTGFPWCRTVQGSRLRMQDSVSSSFLNWRSWFRRCICLLFMLYYLSCQMQEIFQNVTLPD
jgi:hypothetical protein